MSDASSSSVPRWFYVLAGVAVVWNVMGVGAYFDHVSMTPEAIAALPEAERALFESTPVWAKSAFAVAVWAGLLGSILLVVRRKIALSLLWVSLGGIIVQNVHGFVISDAVAVYGAQAAVFPAIVLAIGIGLIVLARRAIAAGWMR